MTTSKKRSLRGTGPDDPEENELEKEENHIESHDEEQKGEGNDNRNIEYLADTVPRDMWELQAQNHEMTKPVDQTDPATNPY